MKVIIDFTVTPDFREEELVTTLSHICGCSITVYSIIRKSLDARKALVYHYRCRVDISEEVATKLISTGRVLPYSEEEPIIIPEVTTNMRVPVIGCSSAGLFCALTLIEAGVSVDIYERGKVLDERHMEVALLREKGNLNTESNVVFGQSGAGTYSDGKLTTRIDKKEIKLFYYFLIHIINSSSDKKRLCVNGMSYSQRNEVHSNAAWVLTVAPDDVHEVMNGINFQISLEVNAYTSSGGKFIAPAQRLTSFLQNSVDSSLPV